MTKMPEPQTLWEMLTRAAQETVGKGLIVQDNSTSPIAKITYKQLWREAQEKAELLRQNDMITGDRVLVLYFESHLQNIMWCWAVIAAGGIPAIMSPLSSEKTTMRRQLENVNCIFNGPKVLTSWQMAPRFRAVEGLQVFATGDLSSEGKMMSNGHTDHIQKASPNDLAVILFTSGSTGHSKAVEFTHHQLLASVRAKVDFHDLTANTKFFTWISFDHSVNFCEMHLCSMYIGSDQYHAATADLVSQPANFFNIIGTNDIGYAFAPSFYLAIATKAFLAQGTMPFLDFSKLQVLICGGEANKTANIQAADELLTRHGARQNVIRIAYGLSETCSCCFYNTEAPTYDLKHGNDFISVGRDIGHGMEFRLVDDTSASVPTGTTGSIQIRGDNVFQRYYNNPVATAECKTPDGWFNTGDLGVLDSNGQLSIVGRSKEMLIINGNNYSSFELEHCVETDQPSTIASTYTASFGVWDEKNNTEGVVIIFSPYNSSEPLETLQKILRGIERSVIKFCRKAPMDIIPLPKSLLPKSTLGKLSRASLKKQYLSGALDQYKVSFHETPQGQNGFHHAKHNSTNGVQMTNGNMQAHDITMTNETSNGFPSEMLETIARIISDECKIPITNITSTSPISELGIDSLSYMRIRTALQNAFGMEDEVPMALLLQSVNIKEIEEGLLAMGTVPTVYQAIVPLSTTGSKMPLFLLHPGSGEVLCWLPILKYLPDRPIYAIRAKGLHKSDGWFENLDEMIDCYLSEIRQRQPHGPYAMLGFCLGGSVAFELAKRLEAEGEEIAFLAGIDNPPDLRNLRVLENFRDILTEFLPQMGLITKEQMDEFNAEHDENTHFEDLYRALVKRFGESILVPFDITLPGLIQRARVDHSMREIFKDYLPKGSVSKFDVFWVPPMPALKATLEEWRDQYLGEWNNYSKTKVNYYPCIGDHLHVMQGDENVECFQKALNQALIVRGI